MSMTLRAARQLTLLVVLWPVCVSAETRHVPAGGDLQAALNAAQPCDIITLQAGATYTGNFVLPPRPGGTCPTIITTTASLPTPKETPWITPAEDALMPRLQSPSVDPVLYCSASSDWTLDGIRIMPTSGGMYNAVFLEERVPLPVTARRRSTQSVNTLRSQRGLPSVEDAMAIRYPRPRQDVRQATSLDICRNIKFDRMLLLADEPDGQRRMIAGNGANITLTRSYCANVFRRGDESNCFAAWVGPGPFTITHNFLEASGINTLFGGADSKDEAHAPANLTFEGNFATKRMEWKTGPLKATVKNLFELKHMRGAKVVGNIFERNWTDAQNGFGILLSTSDDTALNPWTVIEHVVFERFIVRDSERGINISGHDGWGFGSCSKTSNNLTIRNGLLSGDIQIGSEHDSITIDRVTQHGGGLGLLYKGGVSQCNSTTRLRLAKYAVRHLTYTNSLAFGDLNGDEVGPGMNALNPPTDTGGGLVVSYTWTNNALGGATASYPAGTVRATAAEHQAQFNPDWTLKDGAYKTGNMGWPGPTVDLPPLPPPLPPPASEICGDQIDNDGDGLIDEDPPCAVTPPPPPPPPPTDECAARPILVTVQSWPTAVSGQRTQARFTVTSPRLAASQAPIVRFLFSGPRAVAVEVSDGTCLRRVNRS